MGVKPTCGAVGGEHHAWACKTRLRPRELSLYFQRVLFPSLALACPQLEYNVLFWDPTSRGMRRTGGVHGLGPGVLKPAVSDLHMAGPCGGHGSSYQDITRQCKSSNPPNPYTCCGQRHRRIYMRLKAEPLISNLYLFLGNHLFFLSDSRSSQYQPSSGDKT